MEGWKVGRLEGWKVGRLEGWKVRRLEGWKVEGVLSFPLFPDTSTELSGAGANRGVCNCIRTTIPSSEDDDDDLLSALIGMTKLASQAWWLHE